MYAGTGWGWVWAENCLLERESFLEINNLNLKKKFKPELVASGPPIHFYGRPLESAVVMLMSTSNP